MNYRAVRLALRVHLQTLTVCTTGSTTLEATATGYARSSGSFIDDGFAAGMEVTPSGFTQTSTTVVKSVTALTLTTGTRSVQSAGASRSLSVLLPTSRSWENMDFTPEAGVPFVTEDFVPGPSRQITLGQLGEMEGSPLYAPKVHVPTNTGVGAGDAYADAILRLFAPRTLIDLDDSRLQVRTNPAPYRGQLLPSRPGFSVVPVTIPLILRTANII